MISIKKADWTKKKEYSKEMKLDGFISSVELTFWGFTQGGILAPKLIERTNVRTCTNVH